MKQVIDSIPAGTTPDEFFKSLSMDEQSFKEAIGEEVRINTLLDTVNRVFDDIGEVMSAMARGDLSKSMIGEYEGQYAQVKGNINDTIRNLEKIVGDIRDATEVISSGAGEIVTGNNNLSARTEQQASSLEETASSMEELTSTVQQNAENSKSAGHCTHSRTQTVSPSGRSGRDDGSKRASISSPLP